MSINLNRKNEILGKRAREKTTRSGKNSSRDEEAMFNLISVHRILIAAIQMARWFILYYNVKKE